MTRLYLGVDGGQSSTTALIADESGRVLGRGRAGPCNHVSHSQGRAKFMHALGESLGGACHEAGLDEAAVVFAGACLGFSGGPEDKESYSRELIHSPKFKITHDADVALSGATAGGPGIIVIAGTGSIAFGRNAERQTARAGGWGYIFGDEGGAFDLVRRAVRAALQYEEGWGPQTTLRALLLETTGASDANSLLHRMYGDEYSRDAVARLAPLITQAADEEDAVARAILTAAAGKLVWLAEGVHRQLFHAGEQVLISGVGGVFQSALLAVQFESKLWERTGCRATRPRFGPACGALLEALRLDDNQSDLSDVPESEK